MTGMIALLVDSVRQLKARALFWLGLLLSGMIVLALGSIGFNDQGLSIMFGLFEFEHPLFRAGSPMAVGLMDLIFSNFVTKIWLAWGAVILALVSTAGVFPDFLADGSVDLVLCRPMSRLTVFLTKYLGSLLFVLVQLTIFCVGVFLVFGLRLGMWRWPILLAIPLVLAMYSYLYAIMVLANVVTRSALASLIITMLFWFVLFGFQATEGVLNQVRLDRTSIVEGIDHRIEVYAQAAEKRESDGDEAGAKQLRQSQSNLEEPHQKAVESLAKIELWHTPFRRVMWFLPKTGETTTLVQRYLDRGSMVSGNDVAMALFEKQAMRADPEEWERNKKTSVKMEEDFATRSTFFILGTSLGFEFVVLGLAAVLFIRRDY